MICNGSVVRLRAWKAAPAHVSLKLRRAPLSITAESQTSKNLARAVKAVKIKLITVSKGNSKGTELVSGDAVSAALVSVQCLSGMQSFKWYAATGEWADKIRRYTQFEHLQVKPNPKKAASPQVAVQSEGEKVLKATTAQVSRVYRIGKGSFLLVGHTLCQADTCMQSRTILCCWMKEASP